MYVTQELRDAFVERIEEDNNFIAKGNLNAVINKLIYDYVYGVDVAQKNSHSTCQSAYLEGLSNSEMLTIEKIVSNPVKKQKLFELISDSITLSM